MVAVWARAGILRARFAPVKRRPLDGSATVRALLLLFAVMASTAASAECPDSWDGPTRCFDRLGSYPLGHLKAARGVTLKALIQLRGKQLSSEVQTIPNPDYPGIDRRIVTLNFPRESVTLSRRTGDALYWVTRYETRDFNISLEGCELHTGQRRPEVRRLLGFNDSNAAGDTLIWHHQWCESDLNYEEWATVFLKFDDDGRLQRIIWEYWAD